jgi:hypothetical protein
VDDYRILGAAVEKVTANPTALTACDVGKAVCSFLFTFFMNVNWFIKSGLLKWDKDYWGDKQNLVRIWVAIYSLYPVTTAYLAAAAKPNKTKADRQAVLEAQLNIVKTVADFITCVRKRRRGAVGLSHEPCLPRGGVA